MSKATQAMENVNVNVEKIESAASDLAVKITENDSAIASSKIPNIFHHGNHEVEMCYGGEADLHKHVAGCKKNPGHKGFIPINDFNKNYLPSRYHDDDLMSETIKTLAALTVQVKTEFTSLERPEFYPGTQVPYPFYNNSGSDVMRVGTGKVWEVRKIDDDGHCFCAKCNDSGTASDVYWQIIVVTATHVVFDDDEAKKTSCIFGFDDDKSRVVSLDRWDLEVTEVDIKKDWCKLKYETCDFNEFVDKLDKMCVRYHELCVEVRNKYMRFDDVDRLTVIVSHPHGCPKQVSVGRWTHKREDEESVMITNWPMTRYWYTTCTCPGSSGAPVYRLGYAGFTHHHPHHGCDSEGNYSAEYFG